MTRGEAIAIIRKEYLCVDRDCDIEKSCGRCDLMMPSKEPILQAYKMAIQALKEPTRDLISRQAVINITAETGALETQARVMKLPSYSEMPNKSAEMTWVTGADGAKVAFKDVPIDKVVKICEILGEDGGE